MNILNGRFHFDWVINILSKDEDGFQIELADLGNGKHMIVATDLTHPISKDLYRQAGFGPFVLFKDESFEDKVQTLKEHLLKRRNGIE